MKSKMIAIIAGSLILSPAAFAQTESASAPSAANAPIEVSNADVAKFAKAVVALQKIETEKQVEMEAAVKQAGLDRATFNAIAQQAGSDPALKTKIQQSIAGQPQ
jgi:hypothetical protein